MLGLASFVDQSEDVNPWARAGRSVAAVSIASNSRVPVRVAASEGPTERAQTETWQ